MKLFVRITLIYFSLNLFTSCNSTNENTITDEVYYFDLSSLVDTAIEDLKRSTPKVEKKISYDGEKNALATSEINWTEELEIFEDADINKPILKNSYEKTVINSQNGVTVTRFEAIGPREQVRWLEVEKNKKGEVQSVSFKMLTDNSLYASEKEGKLVFSNNKKLEKYSIEGMQSIVFLGEKHYSVEGNLMY